MTSQVTAAPGHRPREDGQIAGVACLLLALEKADPARVAFKPLARLGEDFVRATVMIDVGEGALPFDLESVRLAAACLRIDPPIPDTAGLAERLSLAADQAEASARRLMTALH